MNNDATLRSSGGTNGLPARDACRHTWRQSMVHRLRRNSAAVLGLLVIMSFSLTAVFAPSLAPYDPMAQNLSGALELPGGAHLLGTDELGRDILSRILIGARISLVLSLGAVTGALVVGSIVGMVAGYYGRRIDMLLMRCVDVMMAIPGILLAITIIAVLGVGMINIVVAVAINGVPVFARLSRASTLAVKENEYLTAAKALGATDPRRIFLHIAPNIAAPLLVQCTLFMATSILVASSLSFLGLGAQPPTPEWGAMLSNGRSYLSSTPHVAVFPGIAIMLVVLGFNMLGDGLRDVLDPRLKN